jgi:hypothetical protein
MNWIKNYLKYEEIMKIEYDGITLCPYKEHKPRESGHIPKPRVGSVFCTMCKFQISNDIKKSIVYCSSDDIGLDQELFKI